MDASGHTESAVLDTPRAETLQQGGVRSVLRGRLSIAMPLAGVAAALWSLRTSFLHTVERRTERLRRSWAVTSRCDREMARAAEALRGEAEHRGAKIGAALQTSLESIDQGVIMVGADRRVAAYNQRVLAMLDLPNEALAQHPQLEAVAAALLGFEQDGGMTDRPHVFERKQPNGRVIEVRNLPLQDGGCVRTYSDITDRKAAEARLRFIAHHDGLTLLANRRVLQDHLHQAVAASASMDHGVALLYLDLDRFKPINDLYGHAIGDQLLIEVAQRMRGMVREEDLIARMGGDEFAIVQTAVGQPEAAASLAQRLIERMAEPFFFNGLRVNIGMSVGISVHPINGANAAELRRNADVALYRAKESGRNAYRFFDAAMDARQQAQLQMEQDLRDAVGLKSFHVMYQPITDLKTETIVGFEALLRWTHPTLGPVGPEEFVSVAELNGLIVPLGHWMMETACAEAATWPTTLYVAVNVSPLQFRQGNLIDEVTGVLGRTGLAPDRLELEVTEGMLLEDSAPVLQTMQALQALGVSITLDDFGTGHASLSYLRRFPFDKLKIDKSFIRNLQEEPQSAAIVEAVLWLSGRLGLNVVAEGVETPEQLAILRGLACPLIQGFLRGRPMPAEAARRLAQ